MAVQFFSQSTAARSASFPPFLARYLRNQPSPACAWLTADPASGPRECFEAMSNEVGVSAPMKMMHPFDFNVTLYGASVCASIASH